MLRKISISDGRGQCKYWFFNETGCIASAYPRDIDERSVTGKAIGVDTIYGSEDFDTLADAEAHITRCFGPLSDVILLSKAELEQITYSLPIRCIRKTG